MRTRHLLVIAVALGAATLSSCDLVGQWLGLNFTVSGSLSASSCNLQSSGTVKVTNGTDTVSGTFTIPGPQTTQSGTFSLKFVPKGTYTVTVTVVSGNQPTPPTATLNGKTLSAIGSYVLNGSSYNDTVTVSNVLIDSNSTLSVVLPGAG